MEVLTFSFVGTSYVGTAFASLLSWPSLTEPEPLEAEGLILPFRFPYAPSKAFPNCSSNPLGVFAA